MTTIQLVRKTDRKLVARAKVADTFLTRLVGLIGKRAFESGEGLLFPKNNSIHMWMMSISIDVLFLKKTTSDWEIAAVYENLKPWKALPVGCWGADDALELPVGTVSKLQLKKGEVLCIAS